MTRARSVALFVAAFAAAGGWDPVQQSQLGRTAWRNAGSALRAGDSAAALVQLRIAHEAWPAQPAYSETLVRLAARLGDTAAVATTLNLLAAQGLGASAASDRVVVALGRTHPSVARALAAVARASEGPERSSAQIVHDDTVFFPEGVAADARDGSLFISSLRHRNVWVTRAATAGRWLLPEDVNGRGAVFGVKLAADRRSLWLTLAPTPHMAKRVTDSALVAELWQVDRATGHVITRVQLGDGKGIPGELALHPDGSVLVSDAVLGRLYRLRAGASAVDVIQSPLLRSPQGIALLSGARAAIVADWSHGLLRWNLETNEIKAVEAPSTTALLGIDGLLMVDGALVAVQNGVRPMRVLRVRVDEAAERVLSVETLDRPQAVVGEFTVAALVGRDIVYVASSSWPFWNDDAARVPDSGALPPVVLRRFTLPATSDARR